MLLDNDERIATLKYSSEQIEAIKKYYPCSNYEELWKVFPGYTKRDIKSIAHRLGIKSDNPGHRVDLTGKRFGRLIVTELDHVDDKHIVYWKCICDCGNERVVRTTCLRRGKTTSCGCYSREQASKHSSVDHTGEKFGMLTAIERLRNYKGNGRTYYRCICECGNEKIVSGSSLTTGKTKTCGCISKRRNAFVAAFPRNSEDTSLYLIYRHISPIGKSYIGITKQDTARRWQNGKGYNTQKKFWNAIQKYGWENFSHEILAENLTEEEACSMEIKYIEKYKSTNSKYGYNVAVGGTTGKTLVSPIMQYYKGQPVNFFESMRQASIRLGVSMRTIKNYVIGASKIDGYTFEEMAPIHLYEIDRQLYEYEDERHYVVAKLMLEKNRKATIARNKKSIKSIYQYDLEGHFIKSYQSITEARKANPGTASISAALRKRNHSKTAGGFQWRYNDGNYADIEPAQSNGRNIMQINPHTYELIAEYVSMAEAERKTGIKRNQINKTCKRLHRTAGGYVWRYKDDPDAFVPEQPKKPVYHTNPICKYSLDGKFLKKYESIAEAERDNPNIVGIGPAVNDKCINKSAGGYMWVKDTGYYGDIKPYHANGRCIEQLKLEDGSVINTYPSIAAAKRQTGIENIHSVCNGKRSKAGGFAWRYVDDNK